MKLSMYNELMTADGLTLTQQSEAARALGYLRPEIALGSFWEIPHELTDAANSPETSAILLRLIEICTLAGGQVFVHGSPAQPQTVEEESFAPTSGRLVAFYLPIAKVPGTADVTNCIEPLSPVETSVINTVADGVALVDKIGSPAFRTTLETNAAERAEDLCDCECPHPITVEPFKTCINGITTSAICAATMCTDWNLAA